MDIPYSPLLADFSYLSIPELGTYLQEAVKTKQESLRLALLEEVKRRGVGRQQNNIRQGMGNHLRRKSRFTFNP